MIVFRRAQAGAILIADMFDAVGAAGRTAPAGHNKGKWALDQRHPIFLQRQQIVHRQGHVIQIWR